MIADQLREIQRQTANLVTAARTGLEALESKIGSIWSDTERLTPQARATDVALALGEGRVQIQALLQDEARHIVNTGHDEVDQAFGVLRRVPPEELAASERALRAALSGAASRP